jgi:hypothetical protein
VPVWAWRLLACGSTCEVEGPLDYVDDASWLCRPGVDRACPPGRRVVSVSPDGSSRERRLETPAEPGLACFGVYPTLDLRLGQGLHHRTDRVDEPEDWARTQAIWLSEVCDLWIPVYRQVRLGTYGGRPDEKEQQCFDAAYTDVQAAFDTMVAELPPTTGLVVFGHSQGGQLTSRLVRERIEPDPELLGRLVVAWPIGWAVATARGADTGGSFAAVPSCSDLDTPGCAAGFRSFLAGEQPPEGNRYVEGAEEICTNPARPEDPTARTPLRAFVMAPDHGMVRRPPGVGRRDDLLLEWPDAFAARCTRSPARLEVEWRRPDDPPLRLSAAALTGFNGTHILDLNLGMSDVVADVRRRAERWRAGADAR